MRLRSFARLLLLSFAIVCILASGALAQNSVPDFSGTWVLDLSKSKLAKHATPDAETLIIAASDSSIRIDISFSGGKETHNWIPDGKEHLRIELRDRSYAGQLFEKAHWAKGVLITELISRVSMPGQAVDGFEPIHSTERWSLSSDKTTLTRTMDDPKQVWVYVKQ